MAYPEFNSMSLWGNPGQGMSLNVPNLMSNPTIANWGQTPTTDFGGFGGIPGQAADLGVIGNFAPSANVPAPSFLDGMIGTKGQPGWGGLALGAASGLMNGWLGFQQYNLAKDSLAQNKKQFQMNWDAQQKTTNAALEDRARARYSANPTAYEDPDSYMARNGI